MDGLYAVYLMMAVLALSLFIAAKWPFRKKKP